MKILPYIYEPEKSIEVYNLTNTYLDYNPHIKEEIQTLGWIYHEVGLVIPQTNENFWSGHYFPYQESWEELQVSLNSCFFGLYKQAFVSLISALEVGMLSVYYNINDEGHNTVQNWYRSSDDSAADTPYQKTIWDILLSNNSIKSFNDKFDLKGRLDNLKFLHNYVHTKGIKYSNSLGIHKTNHQTFEEDVLKYWLTTFKEIITIVTTLHLLKYPIAIVEYDCDKKFGIDMPSFGGLHSSKIERMASILPEEYMAEIKSIAASDPITRNRLVQIESLPDLTEEQIDEQILKSHKLWIEHGEGFIIWERNQYKLYNETMKMEMEEGTKQHIEILRKWATEKGFLESKDKRLGWSIPALAKNQANGK